MLVSVPFALVGSFWTLYLLGLSPVRARLGGPAVGGRAGDADGRGDGGLHRRRVLQRRVREGKLRSRDDIVAAHAEGTVRRLRPKVMTIVTMAAALLPLLWAQGAGAEIMKRVAAPMVGRPGDQRLPDAGGHPGALHDLANAPAGRRAGASGGATSKRLLRPRSRPGQTRREQQARYRQALADHLRPGARKRWKSLTTSDLCTPVRLLRHAAPVLVDRRCRAIERAGDFLVVVANQIQPPEPAVAGR